jgi:hypothetical protein
MDFRPEWQKQWERNIMNARNGDLEAHRRLEEAGRKLPEGTAFRSRGLTCEWCGGKMRGRGACPIAVH